MFTKSTMRNRRIGSPELLETRILLASDLQLGSAIAKPGEDVSLTVELDFAGLPPPEGEPISGGTPISVLLDGTISQSMIHAFPVDDIWQSRMIDGIVYSIGRGEDGRAIAHQHNLATGVSRSILLRNLTDSGLGNSLAYGVEKVGDEITFVGSGRLNLAPDGFAGMIWDSEGNPTQAPYLPDFVRTTGFVHDITPDGFMSGGQTAVAVMWNSAGGVFELPRTELSNALGFGSTGLAMTNDASIIVGGIGASAVAWEAVGDPMNGQYVLKEYGFDDVFPYTMESGLGGFAPESAHFVLDSDAFGTIMFANYSSPEGLRSGAWSVEDGSFIRDFGFGRIQDVFVDGDGNIIVATNDKDYAQSGMLWSFTDAEPLLLSDVMAEYGSQEPYFTRGGLFQTEKGLGALLELEQSGTKVHALAEFAPQDSISGFAGELGFGFEVTAEAGSANLRGMGDMPIYRHEWQEVLGQVSFTVGEDLPQEPFDLSFQLKANGTSWLAEPEVLESMGSATVWNVQTDGDQNEIATFTLQGVDLSGYEVGDQVVIATIAYRPNPNDPVGIPSNVSGGYAEPTSAHGISLSQAVLNGGQELSIQSEVPGLFVPVIYDTDDNGRVGLSDFVQFISSYGKIPGPEYPEAYRFDFDRNGRVGLSDFVLFIQHYGAGQSSGRSIFMPGFMPVPPILEAEPSGSESVPSGSGLLEGEPFRDQGFALEMGYAGHNAASSTYSRVASSDVAYAGVDLNLRPGFVTRQLDERLVDAVLEREDFSELLAGDEVELEFLDSDFDFLADD